MSSVDPYLWLEDVQGERALDWVRQRNAESEALLQAQPGYERLRTRIREVLDSREQIPQVSRRGDWLYNLWRDAAHLQKEDAEYLNRKGLTKHQPALPLFDETDVGEALGLFRPLPLGRPQEVNHAFSFACRDAGHLLGAASADVTVRENRTCEAIYRP